MSNGTPMHLLIVDDDNRIRTLLSTFLTDNGFRVSTAENAEVALNKLKGMLYDLIILDVMMPGMDGFEMLRELRGRQNDTPVIMLTAKGETADRITGLEEGADDYLAKPFEPKELLLRLQKILHRREQRPSKRSGNVRFGEFTYDLDREELLKEGEPVHLTTAEQSVLKVLCRQPNVIFSRERLMEISDLSGELRTVDVNITRLRRKLEVNPRYPRYLHTVRNKGYVLRTDT